MAGRQSRGPVLAEFADTVDARYFEVLQHIARIIQVGQKSGQIREASERSVAHLFLVLLNEFALIGDVSDESNVGVLTAEQFHSFIDGALRKPELEGDGSLVRTRRRQGI